MFNLINSFKNDESLYALIAVEDYGTINFTAINTVTEKIVAKFPFPENDAENFIKKVYFNNKIYKAIIISAENQPRKFCEELRQKLNQLKIPNYFVSFAHLIFSSTLIAANINISYDETVILLLVTPTCTTKMSYAELKFTSKGYVVIREEAFDKNVSNLRERILQSSKPKKIIVIQDPASNISIKNILKSKKLIFINIEISNYYGKFLAETCKWLFDKSYIRYYILPKYMRFCQVVVGCRQADIDEDELNGTMLASVDPRDALPLRKSVIFTRSILECWVQFKLAIISHDDNKYECHKLELKRNCHQYKFNLNIDTESFETYNIEQIILKEIELLPKNLDTVMKEAKIPVIGFFDNSSVVCINKNGSYQFLESCNGIYGIDNFISFDKKKPKFGEAAMKMIWDKATSVVYDLLKIMSMPKENIEITDTWEFKITKDCDNPVLIEYDHNGKIEAASPAFLMAWLIKKYYLKAIRAEIEEKATEIGFWIYDQFNEDEMKRIKEGLENACKLIKIKCCFVKC